VGQRQNIYAKAREQERQDMPSIDLWILKNVVGMRKNATGFHPIPDGLIRVQGRYRAP
jgi:hypothetical protein